MKIEQQSYIEIRSNRNCMARISVKKEKETH